MKSLLRSSLLALATVLSASLLPAQDDHNDGDDDGGGGAPAACAAAAGTLVAVNPDVALEGAGAELEATRTTEAVVPDGYEVAYVLTYEEDGRFILGDVYESLAEAFVIDPNVYRLHTLVAELSDPDDPDYLDLGIVEFGVTRAADVLAVIEEAGICADLELPGARFDAFDCDVTGGLIFSANGTNEIAVCPADGPVAVAPAYDVTAQAAYVIADDAYEIVEVTTDPAAVDFSDFAPGTYNVFLVTYTGALAEGLAGSVYAQRYSDRCFLISDNEIIVRLDDADAGEVVLTDGGGTVTYVCDAGDGEPDVIGFSNPGAADLEYAYVVTDTTGTVIGLPENAYADFDGAGPGVCWVYGVSYTGELTVALGDDLADAALATGCSDLSDGFLAVIRSRSDGGTVSVDGSDEQLFFDGGAPATLDVDVAGNDAFSSYAFFLVDQNDDIVAIADDGVFDVGSLDSGKYFAWGLSYTGELRLRVTDDLFATRVKATGCSRFSDNAVVVNVGAGAGDCAAVAGVLTAVNPDDSIPEGAPGVALEVELTAAPVVPEGYELLYVLTYFEDGLNVIGDVYTSLDEAYVTVPNRYRLHTFVAEVSDEDDANFLDLGVVEFGTTAARDVLALLEEGGICAALELPGATFDITAGGEPGDGGGGVDTCDIAAGTLSADDAAPAIGPDGSAVLTASVATAPSYSGDFELVYVLTAGDDLEIVGASTQAGFEVGAPGTYRIHVLVADAAELRGLDALAVGAQVVGSPGTSAAALLEIVAGLELCADLSAGAAFAVAGEGEAACLADAGTTVATSDTLTLPEGGTVTIAASAGSAPVVPIGTSLGYVLTSGDDLILEEIGLEPSFEVDATGDYRVHALVAPNVGTAELIAYFNDLLGESGVAAATVIGLLDGTGLCYDLDVAGALTAVVEPAAPPTPPTPPTPVGCVADAGELAADNPEVDLGGAAATLTASVEVPASEFEGKAQLYLLTLGDGLEIVGASFDAAFAVGMPGTYRIHSFVADRADLAELDILTLATSFTGGMDAATVLALVEEFDICADLSDGTAFAVTGSGPGNCTVDAGTLTATSPAVALAGGEATVTADVADPPVVPEGFTQAFVLTSGGSLALEAIGTEASFAVSAAGTYTIHSIVLPNVIGESVVDYVNEVIGGLPIPLTANFLIATLNGTDLCYALDVPGAPVEVTGTSGRVTAGSIDVDFEARPDGEGVSVQLLPRADGHVATEVTVSLTDFAGRTVARRDIGDVRAATKLSLPRGGSHGIHAVSVQTAAGVASQNVVLE